jgi:hypothetical protein
MRARTSAEMAGSIRHDHTGLGAPSAIIFPKGPQIVAEGVAPIFMMPSLRGGKNKASGLDSARAH